MTTVRFFSRVVFAGCVGTLLVCCAGYAQAGELSDAVARSLGVVERPAAKRVVPKRPAPVCGAWVELWQGSGKARTCEGGAL